MNIDRIKKIIEANFVQVKNLSGTSEEKPPLPFTSWLDYWENCTRRKAKKCSAINCNNDANVGAHVINNDSNDFNIYLVPLCYEHNNKSDEIPFVVKKKDLVCIN